MSSEHISEILAPRLSTVGDSVKIYDRSTRAQFLFVVRLFVVRCGLSAFGEQQQLAVLPYLQHFSSVMALKG